MLGDTGVAVSPKDHDKDKFVGAKVRLPIVDRATSIFSDFYVDAGFFGTGFVKVTPAHDPNDYGMGERHGLEKVNIFDETAHVVEGYGEFSGMGRDECRQAVVAWFEEHGLLDHVDDHHHSVMHCYRCDSTLEPWLSEQWFVAVDKLKGPATEAVTSGKVTFHPSRWTQTYLTCVDGEPQGLVHLAPAVGGAIASPCSIARTAVGKTRLWRTPTCARSAAATMSRRKRTCSTPGSRASCGHSPRRVGPSILNAWKGIIRRPRSSPRATSSRCGWRASIDMSFSVLS